MASETDEQFVERISRAIYDSNSIHKDADLIRLFALARRGAEAADRIEQLEAEVLTWQGHAKTAIWGDSEECKSLSAEVDRLVRSRNKWGQRYNKLLLKIRAGENGETDDPASWQLRMALDDANVKNDEAAARIEKLEAALDTVRASGLLIGSTTLHDRVRSAVYNAIDALAEEKQDD